MTIVFILFLVGIFILFAIPGYLLGLIIFAPFRREIPDKPHPAAMCGASGRTGGPSRWTKFSCNGGAV